MRSFREYNWFPTLQDSIFEPKRITSISDEDPICGQQDHIWGPDPTPIKEQTLFIYDRNRTTGLKGLKRTDRLRVKHANGLSESIMTTNDPKQRVLLADVF